MHKYSEFVATKDNSREIVVSCENYKKFVQSELSSLVLRKNQLFDEAKKYLIDFYKIQDALSQSNYPEIEAFKIAIKSYDLTRIKACLEQFKKYKNNKTISLIESNIFNFESKLLGENFDAKDVDISVDSLLNECDFILNKLCSKVYEGLQHIECSHYPVKIEACLPKNGIKVEKANVIIQSVIPLFFEFNLSDFTVQSFSGDLPENIQLQHNNLMNCFIGKNKTPRVVSGYLAESSKSRKELQDKQTELSLGIKSFLKKETVVYKTPPSGDHDIWKVKLNSPEIFENSNQYKLTNDAPIRWIELLKRSYSEK
jgi:hypothetical protein